MSWIATQQTESAKLPYLTLTFSNEPFFFSEYVQPPQRHCKCPPPLHPPLWFPYPGVRNQLPVYRSWITGSSEQLLCEEGGTLPPNPLLSLHPLLLAPHPPLAPRQAIHHSFNKRGSQGIWHKLKIIDLEIGR